MVRSLRVFFLIIVVAISAMACGAAEADDPKNVINPEGHVPITVNYQNNVYYFPYTEADFGNALSAFIGDHPELEVLAISGDGTQGYGHDRGYFVVFREVERK